MGLSRKNFILRLIRAGLAIILLVIAYFLAGKTVAGKDCSVCPGYGVCKGETDCDKY